MNVLASLRFALCDSLGPDLVEELDDHVVLLYAHPVKVFSHDVGQLVLGLPPEISAPCDGRRVEANAARLREDPLVVVAEEGCRRLEAECAAVSVEDVSFEGGPLQLSGAKKGLAIASRAERTAAMQENSQRTEAAYSRGVGPVGVGCRVGHRGGGCSRRASDSSGGGGSGGARVRHLAQVGSRSAGDPAHLGAGVGSGVGSILLLRGRGVGLGIVLPASSSFRGRHRNGQVELEAKPRSVQHCRRAE